ncbi:MAG: hypothetical protein H6737_13435 [Alphaproteobacteria bacterium]|nr:hypothetical protein [Alphaproteobacteria bacterium]
MTMLVVLAGCAKKLEAPDRAGCTRTYEVDEGADGTIDAEETQVFDDEERMVSRVVHYVDELDYEETTTYDAIGCQVSIESETVTVDGAVQTISTARTCDANADPLSITEVLVYDPGLGPPFSSETTDQYDREYGANGLTSHYDRTYATSTSVFEGSADLTYDEEDRVAELVYTQETGVTTYTWVWLTDELLSSSKAVDDSGTTLESHVATHDEHTRLLELVDSGEGLPTVRTSNTWVEDAWIVLGKEIESDGVIAEVYTYVCEGIPWTRCEAEVDGDSGPVDGTPDLRFVEAWDCP